MEIMAKYHHGLIFMKGIGAQVKKTVTRRKNLRPQMSERAPTSGAERKERNPLMPTMRPFIRNVWSGKVWKRTKFVSRSAVSKVNAVLYCFISLIKSFISLINLW